MTDQGSLSSALREALDRLRGRDLSGARAVAERAIGGGDSSPPLAALAGLLACQMGDPVAGAVHLRIAVAGDPLDRASWSNLVRALIETGAFDEAVATSDNAPEGAVPTRLTAYALQQLGRDDAAVAAYRAAVAEDSHDFESWNNLGNLLTASGAIEDAVSAFRDALRNAPRAVDIHRNLSHVLARARRFAERQQVMRSAAQLAPDDADIQVELGLAEAAMDNFVKAERAFRRALAIDPGKLSAYLELAVLFENLNRIDDLLTLAEAAKEQGVAAQEVNFIEATVLLRQDRFAEALPLAEAIPETVHPVRRAQLIAQINDRLGNEEGAFAAYREMNERSAESTPGTAQSAAGYVAELENIAALVEPIAARSDETRSATGRDPIFLVGFPRSGTTLLDTMLMNVGALHVMEELPVLQSVESEIGGVDYVVGLSDAEVAHFRDRYFALAEEFAPGGDGKRIVDKFPLHMARMPIIHRLFPQAKVIFVERHPYDVVLSCFMANFQLNRAMANFVTVDGAARLYDLAMRSWHDAADKLPIDRHVVRYERMVDDLESEMRALLGFLDIGWDAAVLDNQTSAAKRDRIKTASYAQVTEPIYRRATGRWQRYAPMLGNALPLLRPWAMRMGYPGD